MPYTVEQLLILTLHVLPCPVVVCTYHFQYLHPHFFKTFPLTCLVRVGPQLYTSYLFLPPKASLPHTPSLPRPPSLTLPPSSLTLPPSYSLPPPKASLPHTPSLLPRPPSLTLPPSHSLPPPKASLPHTPSLLPRPPSLTLPLPKASFPHIYACMHACTHSLP